MANLDKAEGARLLRKAGVSEADIARQLGETRGAPPYVQKNTSRGNSYGAKRTYSDIIGRSFKSDAERRCGEFLWAKKEAGEISDLAFERPVKLLGIVAMRPDFRYVEDGILIHHEYKGHPDARWILQRKLWEICGPTEYRVTMAKGPDLQIFPKPNSYMIQVVLKYLLAEEIEDE